MGSEAQLERLMVGTVAESTYAMTPDNTCDMWELVYERESIRAEPVTHESNIVRSTAQAPEIMRCGWTVEGQTEHEYNLGTYGDLLVRAAMLSSLSATTVFAETASYVFDATAQTIAGPTADHWDALEDANGDLIPLYIHVTGAANSGNNGAKRIVSRSGDTITLAAGSVTDDETISIEIATNWYTAGSQLEPSSFLMEKRFLWDGANRYKGLLGMCVNGMTISWEPQSPVMITFDWIGWGPAADVVASSTYGSGTDALWSTTHRLMPCTAEDLTVDLTNNTTFGDSAVVYPRRGRITVRPNLSRRMALGNASTLRPSRRRMEIDAELDLYFENSTQLDHFMQDKSFDLRMIMEWATSSSGTAWRMFRLPYLRPITADVAAAQGEDLIVPMRFRASELDTKGSGSYRTKQSMIYEKSV